MRSFGDLLSEYTQRAGVSDAELARSIGVQRQTIFRWKEGLVARPRYREDILRIAGKLRLTPEERDALLLAGGFPPEEVATATSDPEAATVPLHATPATAALPDAGAEGTPAPPASAPPVPMRLFPNPGLLLGVAAGIMLLLAAAGGLLLPQLFPPRQDATPTPVQVTLAVPPTAPAGGQLVLPTPPIPTAGPGERLLLVAPFVGYTSDELRFNVAGRIREAIEEEVRQLKLPGVRVAEAPAAVTAQFQAQQLLEASGAAAIIWGEYDAGRVRANITVPDAAETAWVNPVDSVAELPLVMNETVPNAARVLALYTLGRTYREEQEPEHALAAFEKALSLKPEDRATAAALHFYAGTLLPQVRGYAVGVISAAIDQFSAAQTLAPTWENVLYNRGTAYLGRALLSLEEDADLAAAIADLGAVISRQPARVDPLLNRGIAYYQRNDEGDLALAIEDFTRAIELDPTDPRSYYHRGLAYIRRGDAAQWQADLEKARLLAPGDASVLNAFCWGYGISGDATRAVPYCDEAVAADATGSSLDSRAIAYAQAGRYADAASDLEGYLAWVNETYPELYVKYRGEQVEAWIAALRQGANPFDQTTRDRLRQG